MKHLTRIRTHDGLTTHLGARVKAPAGGRHRTEPALFPETVQDLHATCLYAVHVDEQGHVTRRKATQRWVIAALDPGTPQLLNPGHGATATSSHGFEHAAQIARAALAQRP